MLPESSNKFFQLVAGASLFGRSPGFYRLCCSLSISICKANPVFQSVLIRWRQVQKLTQVRRLFLRTILTYLLQAMRHSPLSENINVYRYYRDGHNLPE